MPIPVLEVQQMISPVAAVAIREEIDAAFAFVAEQTPGTSNYYATTTNVWDYEE